MLTKISFDGEKIWSRSVTEKEGNISGLINGKNPDHFDAIGYLPDTNLLSFENTDGGPGQVINFTDNPFSANGITQNNKHIFISNNHMNRQDGASELSLYKISRDDKELLAQETYPTKNPYNRQISFDISALHSTGAIISTGYVEDHGNNTGETKAYVLKMNPDLSTAWQFINNNTSKREQAEGTFSLTNGGVGVIVNARTPISNPCHLCSESIVGDRINTSINSTVVLYRLDKDGRLR